MSPLLEAIGRQAYALRKVRNTRRALVTRPDAQFAALLVEAQAELEAAAAEVVALAGERSESLPFVEATHG